ncbi:MAG: hypothetical protein HW388_947 [Dehalococcoidia bacterium]|nr:hypothetical protein [Dehalococcoidia bacterium]
MVITMSGRNRDRMMQSFASLRCIYHRQAAPRVLLSLLFVASLVLGGCDPTTIITEENRTSFPVKSSEEWVLPDYSGPVALSDLTYNYYVKPPEDLHVIPPGEEMEFVTGIHPKRSYGSREKYLWYAVNLSGEVVYQRTFTWDELNSQGWKVVIEPGVGVDQVRYVSVVNETDLTLTIYWNNRGGACISPLTTQRVALVFVGEPSSFRFEARKAESGATRETEVVFAAELTEGQLERQNWTIVITEASAP